MVPYNNPASYLHIIYYLTGTNFVQSLILQQEVVVTALAEMAFKEQPLKSLVNLIHKVQERDTFIYFIHNQLAQE